MTQRLLLAFSFAVALGVASHGAAAQNAGARAGNSVVPTTHSSACGGVLCDGVDPPRQADGTPVPPPPCNGIICGDRPVTASEAKRLEDERARAAAAAPPETPAAAPAKSRRKAKVARKKAPVVATRTPAPVEPAPPAPR